MNLTILSYLSQWLSSWLYEYKIKEFTSDESIKFFELFSRQHLLNTWHTEEDIIAMLNHLSNILNHENLITWTEKYPDLKAKSPRTPVLIKPNINYAFSGFHEWLSCIITQTPFVLKADNNQYQILKFLTDKLIKERGISSELFDINPVNTLKCQRYIIHAEKNESLNQYFSPKKAIILEPRNTVGIITGNETSEDISNLGKDIFHFLGQSPRSLRKLYLPAGFDIKEIILALEPYSHVYRNNKYANNYDYHQSVYLMNRIPFLDNGFLIFKEDKPNDAPNGCLFYEYYSDYSVILNAIKLAPNIENIVCINDLSFKTVKPGKSHFFNLWDYLNDKDLVEFLLNNQRL